MTYSKLHHRWTGQAWRCILHFRGKGLNIHAFSWKGRRLLEHTNQFAQCLKCVHICFVDALLGEGPPRDLTLLTFYNCNRYVKAAFVEKHWLLTCIQELTESIRQVWHPYLHFASISFILIHHLLMNMRPVTGEDSTPAKQQLLLL
jgi:hypothetical protein